MNTDSYKVLKIATEQDFLELVKTGTPEQIQTAIDSKEIVYKWNNVNISESLLLAAEFNSNPEVISFLLTAGADVDQRQWNDGQTPLIKAAKNCTNPQIIKLLLKAGAYPKITDKTGHTAIYYAERNANLNRTDAYEILKRITELDFLKLVRTGTPTQVRDALAIGAKTDELDTEGTPLMLAAAYNPAPEVIQLLIKAGAKIDQHQIITINDEAYSWYTKTYESKTPLMFAAKSNNPSVVKALLDAGASIKDKTYLGWTPLMYAASWNTNPEVTSLLLKAGADVNERDNEGTTPLMRALENNTNSAIITMLIDG